MINQSACWSIPPRAAPVSHWSDTSGSQEQHWPRTRSRGCGPGLVSVTLNVSRWRAAEKGFLRLRFGWIKAACEDAFTGTELISDQRRGSVCVCGRNSQTLKLLPAGSCVRSWGTPTEVWFCFITTDQNWQTDQGKVKKTRELIAKRLTLCFSSHFVFFPGQKTTV